MPLLRELALAVFELCVVHHVTLEPEWIPREKNKLADYVSKLRDYDDWMVHLIVYFYRLTDFGDRTLLIGLQTITILSWNGFNSRFWNPGMEAIDTFTIDWSIENN